MNSTLIILCIGEVAIAAAVAHALHKTYGQTKVIGELFRFIRAKAETYDALIKRFSDRLMDIEKHMGTLDQRCDIAARQTLDIRLHKAHSQKKGANK